jgi:membrane protein DedA with SNARE-associated domain
MLGRQEWFPLGARTRRSGFASVGVALSHWMTAPAVWCYRAGQVKPGFGNQTARHMFESLEAHAQALVEFVRVHQTWAAPVVFALAFGESLAFISLLLPAWAALVGIGALISSGSLNFWPVWVAGSVGAALGDWLSYWIGLKLGPAVGHLWPLSRHPELLPRGEAFVKRWGVLAIFIGRFFGPLRASVPLVAGIFRMPVWQFQIANFTSAFVWAAVLLGIGDVAAKAVKWMWG